MNKYHQIRINDDDEDNDDDDVSLGYNKKEENEEIDMFEFKNIKYSINNKKILNGISGNIKKGEFVGVLGHSGAGKSTLLNVLSGRLSFCDDKLSGDIYHNQEKITNTSQLKDICGYVTQKNVLYPTSTARECIEFSAKLRLPQNVSKKIRENSINSVISALKLLDCETSNLSKFSGGEAKRVSIGIELVTNPQLLFLDEVTSGLDSHTAFKTIKILKNLTKYHNKQIFITIHQPSKEIFQMFDKIILISKGHCVYFGETKNIIQYFKLLGYHCPKMVNFADFIINSIENDPQFFISSWNKFENKVENNKVESTTFEIIQKEFKFIDNIPNTSCFKQIWLLLIRDILSICRYPFDLFWRLFGITLCILVLVVLYFNIPNTMRGAQDLSTLIFYITTYSLISGMANSFKYIPIHKQIMIHERATKTYYTFSWIISKLIIMQFILFIEVFTYSFIITFGVFYSSWNINLAKQYFIILYLGSTVTCSFSFILSCFTNNLQDAMQILPIFTPLILLNNLSADMSKQFKIIQFLKNLNYVCHIQNALFDISFHGKVIKINTFISQTGEEYLEYLGIPLDSVSYSLSFLTCITLIFWMMIFLILIRKNGF